MLCWYCYDRMSEWKSDGTRSDGIEQDAEIAGASSGPHMGAQAEAPRVQPAVKRKREESLAWDQSTLDAGADELSFEEVRPFLLAVHTQLLHPYTHQRRSSPVSCHGLRDPLVWLLLLPPPEGTRRRLQSSC